MSFILACLILAAIAIGTFIYGVLFVTGFILWSIHHWVRR